MCVRESFFLDLSHIYNVLKIKTGEWNLKPLLFDY